MPKKIVCLSKSINNISTGQTSNNFFSLKNKNNAYNSINSYLECLHICYNIMKSFTKFLEEQRVVSFDYSTEPRSAIGAVNVDKLVKTASILLDGPVTTRKFRLAIIYVNPRRDDGRSMDVFPAYGTPACSSVDELRALNPDVNDAHGAIAQAINDFEQSPLYKNLKSAEEE